MDKRIRFSIWYYLVILAFIFLLDSWLFSVPGVPEISYSDFRDRLEKDAVQSVIITPKKIYGVMKAQPAAPDTAQVKAEKANTPQNLDKKGGFFEQIKQTPWRLQLNLDEAEKAYEKKQKLQFTVLPLPDDHLLEVLQSHGVNYRARIDSNWLKDFFLNWIIPFGIMFLLWGVFMRRMRGGPGALSVGKSKAKVYEVDASQRVTFHEVAGIDEAVEEVKEVVGFLKEPRKYARLGARLPKGILLVGPPGTGKTLLARAVAGEADVPFFSLSGSDFVEMFVGVGAARVRDLFLDAKKKAPCIIFIDELDAVGKSRGRAVAMGGYDERENTLNQLLTEMDGFAPQAGIVIMGATNRLEVLDDALLRPGRFDRQVLVDRPDLNGRVQIFEVHTRSLPLGEDVDLHRLAAMTPGFAGAEIANVCNEAALMASRRGGNEIEMENFQNAIERVIAGLEKKNKLINPHEREIVAIHESGHAIVGYFTAGADPVQKVSIVPRGMGALGYTMQTPLEDRYLMTRRELLGKVKGLLAGRAAEEVVFGEISTGASNDLERVSKIVREMLTVYGMSLRVPNLSLVDRREGQFLGYGPSESARSEKLEQMIDEEALEIIRGCYEEDKTLLEEKRGLLDRMAQTLLEKEKIDEVEIVAILGPHPGNGGMGKG